MLQGRGKEMAAVLNDNPKLLVKLAATSVALSIAAAKLYTYNRDILADLKKDVDYYEQLKLAYIDSADNDEMFAEMLAETSAEVDNLMLELSDEDEF
jgi:hypothetical protein